MRRAFIACSLCVFLVYAWASVAYQNRVDVPGDDAGATALLERKYVLRDPVYNPADPAGEPFYRGGRPLDEAMLRDLRAKGVAGVAVSGHAPAVNFQLGTALMAALIFFTLVAALKPVVWDPFTALLEKRRRRIERGNEARKQNLLEADNFAKERARRNAEAGREIQALRLNAQRETAKEAAAMLRAAREKEKEAKREGREEIAQSAGAVREAVEKEIPALAAAMADAISRNVPERFGG